VRIRTDSLDDDSFDSFDELSDPSRPEPMRARRSGRQAQPERRGRLTEDERERLALLREDDLSAADRPTEGDRWSNWGDSAQGPLPRPPWVITELVAEDTELGVLKTGKEADVHLLRRAVPGQPGVLLAAKRYRGDDHRTFHRDAQYLEGRQLRRSRENRAMAARSSFGRNLIAEQWSTAEFAALCRLWTAGVPVPYPVQLHGTEVLLEFLGDADGTAAPRLAQLRPEPDELEHLWERLLVALTALAAQGLGHGDLSPYNVLVHRGEPVLIDLPQVIDLVANPRGPEFLARDVRNVLTWFAARGLPAELADPDRVTAELLAEAGHG
jgi:RIO kinase 1